MKKNLPALLTLILAPFVFYLVLKTGPKQVSCPLLMGYDYDDFKFIGQLLILALLFAVWLLAGILGFYLLKRFMKAFQSAGLQASYIVFFYALLFYLPLRSAFQKQSDAAVVESLCTKTSGDVMKVKSTNMTYPEYQYLQKQLILLPGIAAQSDSISIDYYHDGLLPDFSLIITFRLPVKVPVKTGDTHWFETGRDSSYKWIRFEDDAM